VHHDVWDFDMPTPPILVDVRRDGRVIPAVLQTGKMNYVYIFDRVTGEPLFGMEERPVPQSEEPDEWTSPTQPFPLRPGPIGRVGMARTDINTMTPDIERFCTGAWETNRMIESGPYWRPTARGGLMTFPSSVGGPNWGPLSYNPDLGYVFINLHNTGAFRAALSAAGSAPTSGRGAGGRGGRGGDALSYRLPNGTLVPCYAPPYGELVAIDVNRGEIAWKSTLGTEPAFAPLGDAAVRAGTQNLGGSIATASGLVFIGATNDRHFRAFDARTGRELWSVELPASAHSTPMTYMGRDGRQYVVVPAGGGTSIGRGRPVSDALVAFSLPQ
jgi:quinoprotein glucose dehydrogenase